MTLDAIISAIDSEISKLKQARALLAGSTTSSLTALVTKRGPGRPKKTATPQAATTQAAKPASKKRTMSPEGKARIAAAQKKRWAKAKKA